MTEPLHIPSPDTPAENRKHLFSIRTDPAKQAQKELQQLAQQLLPHYGEEGWSRHSLVTSNITPVSRLLYLDNLYKQIVDVPGVICEFGVHWGATLTQLINLRSIYEPFNHSRVVYGFDTFEGFPSIHAKDSAGGEYRVGDLATLPRYEDILDRILSLIETFPPLSHVKKFELVKGDVCNTIDKWLDDNPHAVISLAIFDMDLYEPTKYALERIAPRLTRGSILAFDELNCMTFPGETQALDEVFGLNKLRLKRSPLHPYCAWAVYGE